MLVSINYEERRVYHHSAYFCLAWYDSNIASVSGRELRLENLILANWVLIVNTSFIIVSK